MSRDEVLDYLTNQIDLLQRRAVELQEQHDEVEKQLKAFLSGFAGPNIILSPSLF